MEDCRDINEKYYTGRNTANALVQVMSATGSQDTVATFSVTTKKLKWLKPLGVDDQQLIKTWLRETYK